MHTELLLYILLIIGIINLIMLIKVAFSSKNKNANEEIAEALADVGDDITDRIFSGINEIKQDINDSFVRESNEHREQRKELQESLDRAGYLQSEKLQNLSDRQYERMNSYQKDMQDVLTKSLKELQNSNTQKLSDIQTEINNKLDQSLNERLDSSFQTIGEQLNSLYRSLGELGKLENGVMSLNRTLSNVKTRGIFGEEQLENILADILSPNLYDRNVVTKRSVSGIRDSVEFAVKIPDKDTIGEFMYLPIDSKFPSTIYDKIQLASETADSEALSHAVKELEQRIKTEAASIHDKYIDPPYTTDFAVMFLPTESLYAEVLRIPGLAEECRRRYHIVISGPATVAALLNSLSIGFRYMAVNRDSQTVLKLLSAIKSQYQTLSKLINTADSRIEMAKKATKELQHRTDIINKKLISVEEIDSKEAEELLGIKLNSEEDI